MKKLLIFLTLLGCGEGKTIVEQPRAPTEEPDDEPDPVEVTCDGFRVTQTRERRCGGGQTGIIREFCDSSGSWRELDNSCSAPVGECEQQAQNKITFDKHIKPIMVKDCVRCHTVPENYGTYEVAKKYMQAPNYEILDRIRRGDARRMPKPPADPLNTAQRTLFEQWLEDGLLKNVECATEDPYGNSYKPYTLDNVEAHIERDLLLLDSNDRLNSRYLVISHRYNQQVTKEDFKLHSDSIIHSLNSLSLEERVQRPVAIDARGTIFRLDLEDFNLDNSPRFGFESVGPANLIFSAMSLPQMGPPDLANGLLKARKARNFWDLVLKFEPFKFESNTTRGQNIKNLTGSDIPWLHADNFSFTSHREDVLYYAAINAPATFDELTEDLGVDYQELFDEFDTILAGGFGSPISLNKNRLIQRFESERSELARDGSPVWVTFDPDDSLEDGNEEANLFEFPLLEQTGSDKIFSFAAGEVIFVLPNGFFGYYLNDSNGLRQAEAPINVVTAALEDPFNPIIEVSISCGRCHHSTGWLPMNDQIRNSVRNNPSFDRADIDLVNAYFPNETSLNATFQSDITEYRKSMNEAGIDLNSPHPTVFTTDKHRTDWTLQDFCGFVLLPDINECRSCISESNTLLAQLGQLLDDNGSTSLNQIIASFPTVIRDCRINEEDIDQ